MTTKDLTATQAAMKEQFGPKQMVDMLKYQWDKIEQQPDSIITSEEHRKIIQEILNAKDQQSRDSSDNQRPITEEEAMEAAIARATEILKG